MSVTKLSPSLTGVSPLRTLALNFNISIHHIQAEPVLGEHSQAIEDYNKAIELHPEFYNTYYGRGLAYQNLGEHSQAIEDYGKAIELDPNNNLAYYGRGIVYKDLGDHHRAIDDLNKVLTLTQDPTLRAAAERAIAEIQQ